MNLSDRSTSAQPSKQTHLSAPNVWLRLEGLTFMLGGAVAYFALGGHWLLFALLLFVPDVSMVGYLFSKRVGAHLYNLFHSYPFPAALLAFGFFVGQPLVSIALIWFAHIGMDRMIGYGLKYRSNFKDTHLSRV